jgi:hypothetical protein
LFARYGGHGAARVPGAPQSKAKGAKRDIDLKKNGISTHIEAAVESLDFD